MNQQSPIRVRIDPALLESDGLHEVLSRLAWAAAGGKVEVVAGFDPPLRVEVSDALADEVAVATSCLDFAKPKPKVTGEALDLVRNARAKGTDPRAFIASRHEAGEGADMTRLAYYARRSEIMAVRDASRRRLWEWRESWGGFEKSYVIATGPSFDRYREIVDFEKAFVVTCNSAVIDREFMERARPSLVVFGDPIFHFGPSRYAAEFRARLRAAASEFNFRIAVSEKYVFLFRHCFPELEERTVFVPTDGDRPRFHWRLEQDFVVKSTKNILTLLMLPFAASFSRRVEILGCDGRHLAEDSYFWGHSAAAQINDRMRNIQEAHPGFFAIDYNDYYVSHCRQLEQFCRDLERAGIKVASAAPSHIPALARRGVSDDLCLLVDADTENALLTEWARRLRTRIRQLDPGVLTDIRFVSVNPSLQGPMGHPLYQDLSIRKVVCPDGAGYVSLGGALLDARQDGSGRIGFALPVFETPIWQLHRRFGEERMAMSEAFVEELLDALELLDKASPLGDAIVFVYLGHPALLPALSRRWGAKRFRCRRFVFNLFSGFFVGPRAGSTDAPLHAVALFAQEMAPFSDFALVCDSAPFASDLRRVAGVELPLLPMCPSQSYEVETDGSIGVSGAPDGKRRLRVVYPSQTEEVRGFDVLSRFLYSYAEEFVDDFEFVVRLQPERKGADFGRPNLSWVRGVLSVDEYAKLLTEADLVLLPYSPDGFYYRTSSILAEAFSLGKPVVAMSNSWLGLQVSKTGCGWLAERWDPEGLRDVFQRIAREPKKARALRGGAPMRAWCEENRAEHFVRAVLEAAPAVFLGGSPAAVLGEQAFFADAPLSTSGKPSSEQTRVTHLKLSEPMRRRLAFVKKSVIEALPIGLKYQLRTKITGLLKVSHKAMRTAKRALRRPRPTSAIAGSKASETFYGCRLFHGAPPEAGLRLDLDAMWKRLLSGEKTQGGESIDAGCARTLEVGDIVELAAALSHGSELPSAMLCRRGAFRSNEETVSAARCLDESGYQVWVCQWHPERTGALPGESPAWFRICPFPSLPFDSMLQVALLAFRRPVGHNLMEKEVTRALKQG